MNLHDDIKDQDIAIKSSFIMTTINIYGMCFVVHALLRKNVFQVQLFNYILGIESLLPLCNTVLFLVNRNVRESIFSFTMVLCNLSEMLYTIRVTKAAEYEFFWYYSKQTGMNMSMKGKSLF
ncbi:putative transporter [Trachipleistophora hominis]|uniref:Putative transporter n=1 Tax=Trachipleistophora hominis TaxID=72359 RepID=L7JY66_TRAHO|nr:putative transporter [Trachipleistophora hominis]